MPEIPLSLSELNLQVRDAVRDHLPGTYWVRAETSDVRRNQNGHCYLEFVEKEEAGERIVAKARGVIWSSTFEILSAFFETETGQVFTSGLRVLVCVSVEFHQLYGYSLTVTDIDPAFTVGDMTRNRQRILKQLEEEGVLTLNKELPMPELANRIAVVSSPTAAGYEDFRHQLAQNPYGFAFYTKLFPAIMQGERTELSVVSALDKIYENRETFDVVVIIRGGGATSELSSFDSYLLATNCAQFPLPIVSGIGHERDLTVLDVVAHTRVKTPTAAAELLIAHTAATAAKLTDLQQRLIDEVHAQVQTHSNQLSERSKSVIHASKLLLREEMSVIRQHSVILRYQIRKALEKENHFFSEKNQYFRMVSPANILKRGYTLTLKDGKIVKSVNELAENDLIETVFSDGKAKSILLKK